MPAVLHWEVPHVRYGNFLPIPQDGLDVLRASGVSLEVVQAAVAGFDALAAAEVHLPFPFAKVRCMEKLAAKLAVYLRMVAQGDERWRGMALYVSRTTTLNLAGAWCWLGNAQLVCNMCSLVF